MHLIMFSVFDSKAKAYIQPFHVPNADVAKRCFAHAANDPTSDFNRYAADYTLFEIGSFDPQTGIITPAKTHTNHGMAIHYQESLQNPSWTDSDVPHDLAEATTQTIAELRATHKALEKEIKNGREVQNS